MNNLKSLSTLSPSGHDHPSRLRVLLRELTVWATLITLAAGLYTLCAGSGPDASRRSRELRPSTPVAPVTPVGPVERRPDAHHQEQLIASL